jgi:hypothetical protein
MAGSVVGNLSVYEAPKRFLQYGSIILTSLGISIVFVALSIVRKDWNKSKLIAAVVVMWFTWFYVTNVDFSTYTFLTFTIPFCAILACVELSRWPKIYTNVVVACAVALMGVNGIFLNADMLTKANPLATTYEASLKTLPVHSVVVTDPGQYSLGIYYVIAQGYDLIPIVYPMVDPEAAGGWNLIDIKTELATKYGIVGNTTLELVSDALAKGFNVYFAGPLRTKGDLAKAFIVHPKDDNQLVYEIYWLSGLPIEPPLRITK